MIGDNQEQFASPNLIQEYRSRAVELARRFGIVEGVVGVALVGGITRGHADRYSDIDLIVYLRRRTLQQWYLGMAPLPEGISRYHGIRLDVSYRDFEEESTRPWNSSERWQAGTGELIYDPEGLLSELFARQRAEDLREASQHAVSLAEQVDYQINTLAPAWLYRGDPLSAHIAINYAAPDLVALLYRVNHRPVPDDKWRFALLRTLTWTPENLSDRLAEILFVREMSTTDVSRRRYACQELLGACWRNLFPEEEDLRGASDQLQIRMLIDLAEREQCSLNDFDAEYPRQLLVRSPAFNIIAVDRTDEGWRVRFLRDRLEAIMHQSLGEFLDPQQRILRIVDEKIQSN